MVVARVHVVAVCTGFMWRSIRLSLMLSRILRKFHSRELELIVLLPREKILFAWQCYYLPVCIIFKDFLPQWDRLFIWPLFRNQTICSQIFFFILYLSYLWSVVWDNKIYRRHISPHQGPNSVQRYQHRRKLVSYDH